MRLQGYGICAKISLRMGLTLTLLKSQLIYGQAQDVCVPIARKVFCIRSNYFIYAMLFPMSPHLRGSLYFLSSHYH